MGIIDDEITRQVDTWFDNAEDHHAVLDAFDEALATYRPSGTGMNANVARVMGQHGCDEHAALLILSGTDPADAIAASAERKARRRCATCGEVNPASVYCPPTMGGEHTFERGAIVIVAYLPGDHVLDDDRSEVVMYEQATRPLEDAGCLIQVALVVANGETLARRMVDQAVTELATSPLPQNRSQHP